MLFQNILIALSTGVFSIVTGFLFLCKISLRLLQIICFVNRIFRISRAYDFLCQFFFQLGYLFFLFSWYLLFSLRTLPDLGSSKIDISTLLYFLDAKFPSLVYYLVTCISSFF